MDRPFRLRHPDAAVLFAAATLCLWLSGATPAGGREQHNVLLLYPESRLGPAVVAIDDAFRTTLQTRSPEPVYFYTEYLDLNLFDGDAPQRELNELLRRKYGGRRVDLILATTSRALRITVRNRAELFSSAPIVFAAVDRSAAADVPLAGDVTGIWLTQGWAGTLEAALRLQPRTRQVVVISGTSPSADRVWLAGARSQLTAFRDRVDIRYLTDLALEAVLEEVAALPDGTVLLVGGFLRDAAGRNYVGAEAVGRIAVAARVPVYSIAESAIGTGVVGGHVMSFTTHGTAAAELALAVLRGERPPPTDQGSLVDAFDWRQLRRWKLAEQRLPAGSQVRFREPSAWDLYRGYIVGGLALPPHGARRPAERSRPAVRPGRMLCCRIVQCGLRTPCTRQRQSAPCRRRRDWSR